MTPFTKTISIFLVLAMLAIGAVLYYRENQPKVEISGKHLETERYVSAAYKFAFDYPTGYFLDEYDMESDERLRRSIVLTEDNETNRAIREGRLMETEGGPSITIDIFQNDLDNETPEQWIQRHAESNFKISDGIYAKTVIDGAEAFVYTWDGLYRGDSIVFSHKGNIVMLSGTYLERSDTIRDAFRTVVTTLELF